MASTSTLPPTPIQLAQRALAANQRVQQQLSQRASQLQDQVLQSETLLKQLEALDIQDDPNAEVQIPGAFRPSGIFLPKEYLEIESPFREDGLKRNEHASRITPRTMNPKELEALQHAIIAENLRLQATVNQSGRFQGIDLETNVEGIDWNIVAERVSDVSTDKYTAVECLIKWVGDQHPSINHDKWSFTELEKLNTIVEGYRVRDENAQIDWEEVVKQLGTNRSPLEAMGKYIPVYKHKWDSFYDQKLVDAVEIYGINNWNAVASHVSPHVSGIQCQGRYQRSLDPSIKRGTWSPQEDERLKKAFSVFGNQWTKVAEYVPGRINDQCHERWSYLGANTSGAPSSSAPTGKHVWTKEEDARLVELVAELGNKWKVIADRLGTGKTGPVCRLRYTRTHKKQVEEQSAASLSENPSVEPVAFTLALPHPDEPASRAASSTSLLSVGPQTGKRATPTPAVDKSEQTSEGPASKKQKITREGGAKRPRGRPRQKKT